MIKVISAALSLLLSGMATAFSQATNGESLTTSILEPLSEERSLHYETTGEIPLYYVPQSRFGGGIGIMTMPTDRLVAGFMMSLMYSRAVHEQWEVEVALNNHFGTQNLPFYRVNPPSTPMPSKARALENRYLWNYTSADATFLFTPCSRHFRIGGGLSAQYQQQSFFSAGETVQGLNASLTSFQHLMVGANLKADYVLPLTQTLDICFRGQAHGLFCHLTSPELHRGLPDVQLSGLIFLSARL